MKKSFKDKWKEINNFNLRDKVFPGYVVNKNIFRFALILSVLLLFSVLSNYGFDFEKEFIFVECPEDSFTPCINPYYEPAGFETGNCPDKDLCSMEFFNPGDSYGEKPPFIVNFFGLFMLLIFGTALIYNHFKYNKGYKRKNEGC